MFMFSKAFTQAFVHLVIEAMIIYRRQASHHISVRWIPYHVLTKQQFVANKSIYTVSHWTEAIVHIYMGGCVQCARNWHAGKIMHALIGARVWQSQVSSTQLPTASFWLVSSTQNNLKKWWVLNNLKIFMIFSIIHENQMQFSWNLMLVHRMILNVFGKNHMKLENFKKNYTLSIDVVRMNVQCCCNKSVALKSNVFELNCVKCAPEIEINWWFFFYGLCLFQVNVPKQRRTFCKKCKCHKLHKVTQYKKSKERSAAQGRRRYDRKQQGFGGQSKPIFRKKVIHQPNSITLIACIDSF